MHFLMFTKKNFILIFFLVLSIEIMELFQLDNLIAFLFFIRLLSGVVVCICVRTFFFFLGKPLYINKLRINKSITKHVSFIKN